MIKHACRPPPALACAPMSSDHQPIYNEDANQWAWTCEVGVEKEVVGPFTSVQVTKQQGVHSVWVASVS